MLMAQSLPRRMKVKGVRGDKEVGVTCISYHCEDKDMFLVGSEAGVIFKCSMNSNGPPAGSKCNLGHFRINQNKMKCVFPSRGIDMNM